MSGDLNCRGCTCVDNYNNSSEFCGRLVRDGNKYTTLGCSRSCPQCANCDYETTTSSTSTSTSVSSGSRPSYSSSGASSGSSTSGASSASSAYGPSSSGGDTKLDRAEFLEFLKRQQQINAYEDGLYGFVTQDETTDSNQGAMDQLEDNLSVPNNFNQNNGIDEPLLLSKPFRCMDQDKDNCKKEKGCNWNEESITCSNLSVKF